MIRLRKATEDDAEFIAEMILMALHIVDKSFLQQLKEYVLDEDTLYHWSRAMIAMTSSLQGDENVAAGMILSYDGCDYHERRLRTFTLNQPDESGRGEYYIDSLAVLSEYRGKGIGRLLLTDAVERGKAKGLKPSILVLPDNTLAVKLYESVGFRGNEELTVFGDIYRKMHQ